MRPAQDHSQTVTLVDQLFNGDALQGSAIFLDKVEYLTHSIITVAIVVSSK